MCKTINSETVLACWHARLSHFITACVTGLKVHILSRQPLTVSSTLLDYSLDRGSFGANGFVHWPHACVKISMDNT